MVKTRTDEQIARAAERRARFRELAKRLAEMPAEDRAAMAGRLPGVATVEGHSLSLHNTLLLSFQREAVTLVGGFRQWRRARRTVRKGERGLMIWIPKAERNNNSTGSTPEEDGAPGPADPQPAFIMGTVFDVSQRRRTYCAHGRHVQVLRHPGRSSARMLLRLWRWKHRHVPATG